MSQKLYSNFWGGLRWKSIQFSLIKNENSWTNKQIFDCVWMAVRYITFYQMWFLTIERIKTWRPTGLQREGTRDHSHTVAGSATQNPEKSTSGFLANKCLWFAHTALPTEVML